MRSPFPSGLLGACLLALVPMGMSLGAQSPDPASVPTVSLDRVLEVPRSQPVEVFRWEVLPDFLILVFDSYARQDRTLKRLAFFAEKPGYRGRIPSWEEVASLHGWNAHDYEDAVLARFFSMARERGVPLLEEEAWLREVLVSAGVLVPLRAGYAPGGGGLISVSRESPPALLSMLLTHESLHALYYADVRLRMAAYRVWEGFSEETRRVFRGFLSWMGYDVGSYCLVVKELFAYLLQQPLSELPWYIRARILPRAEAVGMGPERSPERVVGELLQGAVALEESLERGFGFGAGATSGRVAGGATENPLR